MPSLSLRISADLGLKLETYVSYFCTFPSSLFKKMKRNIKKQELQEVLKFPIEIFWNWEASLKSELFLFLITLDYGTLINKEIESISNNFDVLCWNSPRCCPRSSPDG